MKIWIICTGEAEGLWPKRCSAAEFETLARMASQREPEERPEKKLKWGGLVLHAPCAAAAKTAEICVEGGVRREEPLLAPVIQRASREGGSASPRHWLQMARLQRKLGNKRQPESRKQLNQRAETLFARLEREGKDCVLIADCLLAEQLLDRARVRGYTHARTGIFRYRPWERILLTGRDLHCGGCGHNCLLSNPGCGIGKDKAARKSG